MTKLGIMGYCLVIIAMLTVIIGCGSDSKTNPVGTSPYANDWYPLADGIVAVYDNTPYDSMGMAGTMHTDTMRCTMQMNGNMMYYQFNNRLGNREQYPTHMIACEVRNDSIIAHDMNMTTGMHEVLEAVLPPSTSRNWSGDWDNLPSRWSSIGQTITVPAGTFNNVAVLQQGPTSADSSYRQFWFAQGVGIIQVKTYMDMRDTMMNTHSIMPTHMLQLRRITLP